jgi:hypothetical protein
MKKLIAIALIAMCGCKADPTPFCSAPQTTKSDRRCHCWIHREIAGTTGCPCDADCDCKPKAKCGCECHCGEPKK